MESKALVTYPSPTPKRRRLNSSYNYVTPPLSLLSRLGDLENLHMAFFVNTHKECALLPNGAADPASDHFCLAAERDTHFVVNISWAIGHEETLKSKSRLVHPRLGHGIQPDAPHGITHEALAAEGVSIKQALEDFMTDALDVIRRGGRLIGHHVALHGVIVERELDRLGMVALQKTWAAIVKDALCLFDPLIGEYVLRCCGEVPGAMQTENALPLRDLIPRLLPGQPSRPTRRPTALENAVAILHLKASIQKMLVPPCLREGGEHRWYRFLPSGPRDNGEFYDECAICRQRR